MEEVLRIQISELIKDFQEGQKETHSQRFCFVLGAGASVSSGIRYSEVRFLTEVFNTSLTMPHN